jgi:uncharacterized protein YoxC
VPVPAPPPLHRSDWKDGVAAQTKAQQSLADIDDQLDAVNAAADELTQRTQQLLDDADNE